MLKKSGPKKQTSPSANGKLGPKQFYLPMYGGDKAAPKNQMQCRKWLVLCLERVSAFLRRTFEPFSRYLAIWCTSRPEIPSSCSPTRALPTLPHRRPRPCPNHVVQHGTGACCCCWYRMSRVPVVVVYVRVFLFGTTAVDT